MFDNVKGGKKAPKTTEKKVAKKVLDEIKKHSDELNETDSDYREYSSEMNEYIEILKKNDDVAFLVERAEMAANLVAQHEGKLRPEFMAAAMLSMVAKLCVDGVIDINNFK